MDPTNLIQTFVTKFIRSFFTQKLSYHVAQHGILSDHE